MTRNEGAACFSQLRSSVGMRSLLMAVSVLLVLGGAAACGHGSGRACEDVRLVPPDGEPFGGAVRTTLTGAEGSVGFHIFQPHDELASTPTMTTVWMAPQNGQVALYFASGVQVLDEQPYIDGLPESPPAPSQIEADYRAAAAEGGSGVVRIHGVLASTIAENLPGNGCNQQNPGSVTLWLGGIQVTVYGHYSTADLVRVAASLR